MTGMSVAGGAVGAAGSGVLLRTSMFFGPAVLSDPASAGGISSSAAHSSAVSGIRRFMASSILDFNGFILSYARPAVNRPGLPRLTGAPRYAMVSAFAGRPAHRRQKGD